MDDEVREKKQEKGRGRGKREGREEKRCLNMNRGRKSHRKEGGKRKQEERGTAEG